MKNTFSFFGLFLVALLTAMPSFATVQVSATVSDNNVILGDRFIFTIIINDKDDDYQLDTRILEKDFTVFRPSRSERSQYGTSGSYKETQWKMKLQAKRIGLLTIPALKIGSLITEPIAINVVEPSQNPQNNSVDEHTIYIENNINKEDIYIGQSLVFTTKIYISTYTESLDLASPNFEGAEISSYGQGKEEQTAINGIRYNIVTQQYKMVATKAGKFEIDSPLLTGMKAKENRLYPINIRGERLTINVKAIPEDFKGKWIISDDLRLIEGNDLTTQSYKVGEPITRSITLQIASVDKDKLPNIKLNYPKSLRVYPDQDQLEEGQANGLNYGIRIIRHAIIADKVGTLTLPEIKINWWNSRTNQQETAILAAKKLTITAADEQHVVRGSIPPTSPSNTTIIVDNNALIYWQIAVAILIITNLFMLFYHLSNLRLATDNKQRKQTRVTPLNQHYITLQHCFNKHSASESYKALLAYAQHQYPTLKSLNQFADKTTLNKQQKQQLTEAIYTLEKCCSDSSQVWNADKLALLINTYESTKNQQITTDPMNLNP